MLVVLQPKVCLCEGYRDMRPSCSEAFALADMRNCSEVLLVLPLCLKIGSLDPPEMALMMFTLLPEGASIARSGICPGSSFGGRGRVVSQENGVELLDHV